MKFWSEIFGHRKLRTLRPSRSLRTFSTIFYVHVPAKFIALLLPLFPSYGIASNIMADPTTIDENKKKKGLQSISSFFVRLRKRGRPLGSRKNRKKGNLASDINDGSEASTEE